MLNTTTKSTQTHKTLSGLAVAALGALLCIDAHAIAADLNLWTAETATGGSSSWTVQPGDDSVFQSVNGAATVYYDGTSTAQGQALNGKIRTANDGDNDFVGFVLGYTAAGGLNDATTDFFLIDWKQADQSLGGGVFGSRGLAISHVTNGQASFNDFWSHNSAAGVTEIERGANLGSVGWVDNVTYDFNLVFTSSLIQVKVNDVLELSIDPTDVAGISSFANGSFGFYNLSQSRVLYSNVTTIDCSATPDAPECQTVPEPTTLALFGLGLLAVGSRRRATVQRAAR